MKSDVASAFIPIRKKKQKKQPLIKAAVRLLLRRHPLAFLVVYVLGCRSQI